MQPTLAALSLLVCACTLAAGQVDFKDDSDLEVQDYNEPPVSDTFETRSDWYGTPRVVPTNGELWPKPQQVENRVGDFLMVRPTIFLFKVTGENCDLLQAALKRYYGIIRAQSRADEVSTHIVKRGYAFKGYLDELNVNLLSPCEDYPYLDMDESYELSVDDPATPGQGFLTSSSVWGILRGLETFTQLLHMSVDGVSVVINSTTINDFPRFRHRGLLLDTSRHFFPVSHILKTLEAMEYNKLNVFHWHIVDDPSFPFQSSKFPELSGKGAFHPLLEVYSQQDIKKVIEFARLRGIRVIPEFDTPGHTYSWSAIPNLLTQCYTNGQPNGKLGPINPIHESVYPFIRELFSEIIELFPERYFHLGGDEVPFDCWKSNPEITEFMESRNMTGDYGALEELYIQRAVDITTELNASAVVWQEVFDNGVDIQPDTVVHVWTLDQAEELAKVTEKGYKTLLSTCWYLDHLASGGDWKKFYECEPYDFDGTDQQKALVMGGEACMWSEFVDESNLESRLWPRASAVAERLWSAESVTDQVEASRRLEEHWCRLKRRGIAAQPPNGPGSCVV